jgi:hypothetical protein
MLSSSAGTGLGSRSIRPKRGACGWQRARRPGEPETADETCVILVDTSVWTDHFRVGDATLATLLHNGHVLAHRG